MKDIGASRSTICTEDSTSRGYRATWRWLIPLATLLIAASILWPMGLGAQTVHFQLFPDEIQVEDGDEFEMAVIVSDAIDLYGIQFDLFFNPAILQVVDLDPSRSGIQMALGDFPFPDFVALHEADNVEGRISYACTQMRPREPVSGSGIALIISFQAIGTGTTSLTLQDVLAATEDHTLDATATSGQVIVVQQAAVATPTSPPEGAPAQVPTRTPLPTHTSPASVATATAMAPGVPAYPEATVEGAPTPPPMDAIEGYPAPVGTATPIATATPTLMLEATTQPGPERTADTDDAPPSDIELLEEDSATPTLLDTPAEGAIPIAPPEAAVVPDESSPTRDIVVALVAPPIEGGPPPERQERPLVSPEIFICLSSFLVLFTALLIFYIAKRNRGPLHSSSR
jgi:hypothetical protein